MSAASEAECIPSSVQDVESGVSIRPGRESVRSKGSRLRPPKPAKCIAPRIMDGHSGGGATIANQQRDDVSELPRYSAKYVRAKVSEPRPLTAAPRQFDDTQLNTDIDTTQPIIKEAAVRSIECIGTTSHDNNAAAAVDTKSSDQQAAPEVPRTAPAVPLKSGRGASQEKSPIAQRTRIPAEQKKSVASSKSQPSIAGIRGGIDGALSETNPDCSSSSTSGSQSGSQSLPSKGDSALTNRHSSLSSSLTSSSSSSLFSVADSESENVARPPRTEPLLPATRPGDCKSAPTADRVDRTGKTGKGIEKSRLAVPKVSVSRCKERFERTLASKQEIPTPPLTRENFCDVDDKNQFCSAPASSSSANL